MITRRPAIFALLTALAMSGGGCTWFRRKPAPQPPPVPAPAPAPAPDPPPAPVVHPQKPRTEPTPSPKPTPTPPPAQPPAFGQIHTPQQQAEFRRTYQQSAQFARQTLNNLSGRALSRDQAEAANRIRSFLSQADEAQSKDPSVAAQLARRAELLARDLQDSIR